MLELHCHTTYSDGTLSPAELVALAREKGVRAIAITDHDTCAGWAEAIAAADGADIEIVPGLELSTVHNGRSLHILGFYPDRGRIDPALAERLQGRHRRAIAMAERLGDLGYPVTLPTLPDGLAPGRPHVAAALRAAGHVRSIEEAFDRFLADGKPAHVQYDPLSIQDGIALLRSAGAVPVWAHPCLFRGGRVEVVLEELMAAGLMGIEVHHPNHGPSDRRKLQALAERHNLIPTGGSDFHGPNSMTTGSDRNGLNQFQLPLSLLEPIKRAAAQLHSITLGDAGPV